MGFPVYYWLLCNDHFSLKFEPYLNPCLASKLTNHIEVALLGSDEKRGSSIIRSCQLPNHLLAPKIKTQAVASKDPDAIAIRHISHLPLVSWSNQQARTLMLLPAAKSPLSHEDRDPTSSQKRSWRYSSRQISHQPRGSWSNQQPGKIITLLPAAKSPMSHEDRDPTSSQKWSWRYSSRQIFH